MKNNITRKPQNNEAMKISRAALLEKEIKAIKAENEQDSFVERFVDLKLIFKFVLLPLIILWSAGTESVFLFANFYETMHDVTAAVALTLLLVIILEVGKTWCGTKFIRFFTHSWLSQGWYYVMMFTVLMVMFVLFYGGSFFMSIKGAPKSADFFTKETKALTLIDLDQINAQFDARIAEEKNKQAAAHSQTWKGHLTKSGAKLSDNIQHTINLIETQRAAALANARSENDQLRRDYNNGISERGTWFQRFAGVGEILQIIILILLQIYSRASYLELPETSQQLPPQTILKPVSKNGFKIHPIAENSAETHVEIRGFQQPKTFETTKLKALSKQAKTLENSKPKPLSENPESPLSKNQTVEEIAARLRFCRDRISQYKWKLRNNYGRAETAQKNINKYEEEIAALRAKSKAEA